MASLRAPNACVESVDVVDIRPRPQSRGFVNVGGLKQRLDGSGEVGLSPPGIGRVMPTKPVPSAYAEIEFLLQGEASTYQGPATRTAAATGDRVPYSTRVMTRFPRDHRRRIRPPTRWLGSR
jgi:Alpha/beta hydrolase domain